MKIYCENPVFKSVAIMIDEYYGSNPAYDKYYVMFGYNLPDTEHTGSFMDLLRQHKRDGYTVVLYQLEQLFRESYWVNADNTNRLNAADEIWEYDIDNIEYMHNNMGVKTPIKFRPMLFSNALQTVKHNSHKDIDVLFYGGLNEIRKQNLTYIQRNIQPYKIEFIQSVWGAELDAYIARSKIVLNLHFFPDNRQEQVRMFQLVSNGCCVVSEFSEGNHMGDSILNVPVADIPGVCRELLRTGAWERFGKMAQFKYKALTADYLRRFR